MSCGLGHTHTPRLSFIVCVLMFNFKVNVRPVYFYIDFLYISVIVNSCMCVGSQCVCVCVCI